MCQFNEEEDVIVYDVHNKVSYKGTVKEVLRRNNYLVESDRGMKHISGSVMSKVSETADRQIDCDNTVHEDQVEYDRESVCSESSTGSETLEDILLGDDVVAAAPNGRRVRRQGR